MYYMLACCSPYPWEPHKTAKVEKDKKNAIRFDSGPCIVILPVAVGQMREERRYAKRKSALQRSPQSVNGERSKVFLRQAIKEDAMSREGSPGMPVDV